MTELEASPGTAADRRGGPPWSILVSGVAWVLTAVALVVAWTSTGVESTADEDTLGTVRSQVGDAAADASSTSDGPVTPSVLLVVAVVLVALAVALAAGQRWSRYPAVLAGVVSVVLLALTGRWETVPTMVLLVVGTIPLLLPGAQRYLRSRGGTA
ncbi:hypothetical protein [Pseudonocardia sp. KRD291]|uniref:hypothetical protein n=1 Tax=Pseudonocardia sp. KRD291 TaxID=2792007 RepID=UPI001C49D5A5|nr:hypothetical protein [Pseudonocardia sp. KRD291]MBW0101175.1 hypothetical protein [Pseudonocardia sp. KRD291]